jgi:plastocyanin
MVRSVAIALVAIAALAAPAAADPPVLFGTVGPGSFVTMSAEGFYTGAAGWQPLSQPVDAGAYSLHVQDNSSGHNFHLVGPGIDQATTVAETGTFDWAVDLQPGTYTFFCDPHVEMRGTFTVRAPAPATTTTPATTTPAPTIQKPTVKKPVKKPVKKKKKKKR